MTIERLFAPLAAGGLAFAIVRALRTRTTDTPSVPLRRPHGDIVEGRWVDAARRVS